MKYGNQSLFLVFFPLKYITEPKLWCARIFWRLLYNAYM